MKVKKYDLRLDKENRPVIAESGTEFKVDGRKVFNSPGLLADFFGDSIGIRQAANEHVYIACIDTRFHIIGCFEASHGSVNESMFPVREILQKALLIGAVNIAVSHNHPAGDRQRLRDRQNVRKRPRPVQPIRDGDQPRRDRATPSDTQTEPETVSEFFTVSTT